MNSTTGQHIVCFSPTGTSRDIAQAVAKGTGLNTQSVTNITHEGLRDIAAFTANDLIIVSVPVYGGFVAPIAISRMENLRGNQTPAVVLTVYGNRAFEKAPAQLAEFLTQRGFIPVAAGAFVGEHSYCTDENPIATGRPDADDLADARNFGQAIAQKLKTEGAVPVDVSRLKQPRSGFFNFLGFIAFVMKYRRQMKKHPVRIVPETDGSRCNACGKCAKLCPTGAIDPSRPHETNAERCIKCAACVKGCPRQARVLRTPFGPALAKYFKRPKPNVTQL